MNARTTKRVEGMGGLTAADHEELAALAARPDAEIDTSDISEMTPEEFGDSVRLAGRPLAEAMELYRARKTSVTARIDRDVLLWLKSKGKGYQTRINAILRAAMQDDFRHRA